MNDIHLEMLTKDDMADDYEYFMAALTYRLEKSKMTQRELAEKTGATPQWLNTVYKRRGTRGKEARASSDLQKAIAEVFGYETLEFLQLGKRIILEHLPIEEGQVEMEAEAHSELSRKKPREQGDYALHQNQRDPVKSLTQLMDTFRELENDVIFWQACLQGIPIPICIVDKNNTVIFQNQADRSFYKMNAVGENLCPACRGNCEIPHPCDDCAIKTVHDVGEPAEKFFSMKGRDYRIIASPINTPRGAFVVVMVVEETKRGKK